MAAVEDGAAGGAVLEIDDTTTGEATGARAKHPLEPLDGAEIAAAAAILVATFGKTEPIRFERLGL